MKVLVSVLLLASLLYVVSGQTCGSNEDCGRGMCCSGGSFHRSCRLLGDNGEPCESPNKYNSYSTACPCKPGFFCNAIRRCQSE